MMTFRTGLLLALTCVACDDAGMGSVELTNASVELDAFSGRPNPTWQMTEAEVRDIETRLRDLPASAQQLPQSTLGYRGFYIRNGDGRRVYVTHGLIAFMAGGEPRRIFRDAHDVEAALKAQARARDYAGVVDSR
jgi:hypothetical protein